MATTKRTTRPCAICGNDADMTARQMYCTPCGKAVHKSAWLAKDTKKYAKARALTARLQKAGV